MTKTPGYAQSRRDYEYLNSLAEVGDLVCIDSEMFSLMQSPTKRHAAVLYQSAIELWFGEHGENAELLTRRAKGIRRRHGLEDE